MEAVLSWVKQIFILSILSTVVTHLMPSAKYTKYASYICGLLIVMVCIQPLAAVFHGGISLDKIYGSVMTYNQSTRLKQELTYREGDSAQSVMEAYEKETANRGRICTGKRLLPCKNNRYGGERQRQQRLWKDMRCISGFIREKRTADFS